MTHIAHQRQVQKYYLVLILVPLKNKNKNLRICTARAGNVIGGGDWSDQRLVPDCMKKWLKSETVKIETLTLLGLGNMFWKL